MWLAEQLAAATQESSIFLTVLLLIWYTVSKAGPTNIQYLDRIPVWQSQYCNARILGNWVGLGTL